MAMLLEVPAVVNLMLIYLPYTIGAFLLYLFPMVDSWPALGQLTSG
jgi:hypothetical protein